MSENILEIIITSSLIASVVTVLLNWFKEWLTVRKIKEEGRYRKLYAPLKFHLMIMKLVVENKTELIKESKGKFNRLYSEDINPLVGKWWEHLRIIISLLESNPELIKKEHFLLIRDLMDGYIKREIIVGAENIKGNSLVTEDKIIKVINSVNNLAKELLN